MIQAVREVVPDTRIQTVAGEHAPDRIFVKPYLAVDQYLFGRVGSPLESVDLGIGESIGSFSPDIIIRLAQPPAGLVSQFGEIEPLVGGVRAAQARYAIAGAIARAESTAVVTLTYRAPGGKGAEIGRARTAIDTVSVQRSTEAAVAPIAGMVKHAIQRQVWSTASLVPPAEPTAQAYLGIGSLASRASIAMAKRRARRALAPSRFRLAWCAGGMEHLVRGESPLNELRPPLGEEWADPFLLHHEGRHHVFFEQIPCGETEGVISTFELSPDGRMSEPTVVLEHHTHLSYPHVFLVDGRVYMIPETGQRRRVELYRAERVPDRWVLEAVLLDEVRAFDATPFRYADRWWMFVSIVERSESPNSQLSLYYADDLVGPWQPHRSNPVVRDVRRARPAGRVIVNSNEHIRPGQDCSTRYGAAITLNRILELSPDSYIERSFARIRPPRTLGAHCIDSDGQVTVLDIIRPTAPAWLSRGRRSLRRAKP